MTAPLEEVRTVAELEHAMVVEALTLGCVLGDTAGLGLPASEIASLASSMSLTAMFRFRAANDVLAQASESPTVTRATSFDEGGAPVSLDPPGGTQPADLLGRLKALGGAVARAYDALSRAASPADEGVRQLIDEAVAYPPVVAKMTDALGDVPFGTLVRVTRREPRTETEEGLLRAADLTYQLLLSLLLEQFQQADPFVGGSFRQAAVRAMSLLDQANTNLVRSELLPAFAAG